MKNKIIAIHNDIRPGNYCHKWIEFCKNNGINYVEVNAYSDDIMNQVKDCDKFMWHFSENKYEDLLMARKVLNAIEAKGIDVYPNHQSNWHFDDKTAQKYLLEGIGAPLVESYVFYDQDTALNWAKNSKYPLVFKLKGGSGSSNVLLLKDYKSASIKIKAMFNNGIKGHSFKNYFNEKIRHFKSDKGNYKDLLKIVYRFFIRKEFDKKSFPEKGYAYFQKFIPKNDFDVRVVVIGDKCFGIKRMNRENDFRASGSGKFIYDDVDIECIKIAFDIQKKIGMLSVAFDFIYENNEPKIVEISYCFGVKGVSNCKVYWDRNLNCYKNVNIDPPIMILEEFINQ
ncbi:ATP-grasp domain-containing protein [Empedobacter stercoris]|uniref:ATP-grasp domain-containing protein n=1 Tax=Empedobacter stercoris TaxID=1628248 RepID=UPI001CE073A9|nr:hypothetical protein [Empedobacter stercoris]MCA4776701.1 hypothetical protein [Empedobacter stercoris]